MKLNLKVSDKACVDVTSKFVTLIEVSLVFAVFGGLVLSFIGVGADGISNYASTEYDEIVAANGSVILQTLYGILANDAIVEVMLVAVFLFVVIFSTLAMLKKAKGMR